MRRASVSEGEPREALARCEAHILRLREYLLDARTDDEIETIHGDLNTALGAWQRLTSLVDSFPAGV
jgi:hypothetical protein